MQIKLRSYFSPLAENDPMDARDIASALSRLGYHTPNPKTGLVPFDPGHKFFNDIRRFQTEHGLFPDGALRPGGETEAAINEALNRLENSGQYYVWRTVRDDKVRAEHKAREGRLFRWDENPGDTPGEDFNCRCWAEPLYAGYVPPPLPEQKPENFIREIQNKDAINPFYGDIVTAAGAGKVVTSIIKIYTKTEEKRLQRLNELNQKIPRWEIDPPRPKLQHEFKHAKDFGVKGNANNKTLEEFKAALQKHVDSLETKIIKGTYHKQKVTHYYNSNTKLNVMRDKKGGYAGSWKLSDKQVTHIERNGKLEGSK